MAEERVQRRLAAILAADVVGYSRLMGLDEAGTRARFNAHLHNLIEPVIADRQGRIVKTMGDGLLVEFASVVAAVESAIAIQNGMKDCNADNPADQRMEFRIGVNLGEVIIEGDDIHGDGVNVAARLEGLADPGGVVISGKVHEEIRGKLDFSFDDLGLQEVKNIAEPVRTFRIAEAFSAPKSADAAPPLPDRPSLAVLPFNNISADSDQEYFADGITEDIITELSKIAGLFVIARNSSFSFKGSSPDVRQISRDLGVRYVLEGSVRKAGARVRVTAQLVDGTTGGHLWAERYDRDLTDIFEMQDDLTRQIVSKLQVQLSREEDALRSGASTKNMEAHDLFLRARQKLEGSKKDRKMFDETLDLLNRAIELDPNYAGPHAALARLYMFDYQNRWSDAPDLSLVRAEKSVDMALQRDPKDALAHHMAAYTALFGKDYKRCASEAEVSLALDPNFALSHHMRGYVQVFTGDPLQAVPHLETAMRLDPAYRQQYLHFLGTAYLIAGRYENAADNFRERIGLAPETDISRALLAAALGHLGRAIEARTIWRELLKVNPSYSLDDHLGRLPFEDPADAERIRGGLHKAGLPEKSPEQDEPLPLPDKPSIAVLPFENMSGDPEQEYFADGLTEDIITALSKFRAFPVIARNSTFTYKNSTPDIRVVGEELGARYVVEGSVRKAGNRVRVTAQLINTETGHHLWAERYDRELEDIFDLQDEITHHIAAIIEPAIEQIEHQRIVSKPPSSFDAWEHCLRAYAHIYEGTAEENRAARELFKSAIDLDPNYARAYTGLAYTYSRDMRWSWVENKKEWLRLQFEAARRAVTLDELDSEAHTQLARAYLHDQQSDAAITEARRAIELNPHDAYANNTYGASLALYADRYEEGISWIEKALRLNPLEPQKHLWLTHLALSHLCAGNYEKAAKISKEALGRQPEFFEAKITLASALGQLGRAEEAKTVIAGLEDDVEGWSIWRESIHDTIDDGLRKAGVLD